jgi:hypothetical protein
VIELNAAREIPTDGDTFDRFDLETSRTRLVSETSKASLSRFVSSPTPNVSVGAQRTYGVSSRIRLQSHDFGTEPVLTEAALHARVAHSEVIDFAGTVGIRATQVGPHGVTLAWRQDRCAGGILIHVFCALNGLVARACRE